jgi:hypothetical protein
MFYINVINKSVYIKIKILKIMNVDIYLKLNTNFKNLYRIFENFLFYSFAKISKIIP